MPAGTLVLDSDTLLSTSSTLLANVATTSSCSNTETNLTESLNCNSMVIWYYDKNLAACIQCVMRIGLFKMFKHVRIIIDEQKFVKSLAEEFLVAALKFVISGEQAEILCSLVEDKSKNYQIYELDIGHPQPKTKRSNTWFTFNNVQELLRSLSEDLNKNDITVDKNKTIADEEEYKHGNFLPPLRIFNSQSIPRLFHSLDKESLTFVLFQLLNKIIIEIKYNDADIDDMTYFCRKHYQSCSTEMTKIQNFFEKYCSMNCICEYTRDCFLFRVLNKIFRDQDTDGIYKFRRYIKDLYRQLVLLSEEQKKSIPPENEITLYRGKKLPIVVLQQLKELYDSEDLKDKLISIDGFLSTTTCERTAKVHAGYDEQRNGYESVLFTLKIDRTLITVVSYADINRISCFSEYEYLISMGSVWQLMKIDRIDAKWMVELKLSNRFDDQIASLPKELSVDDMSNGCYLFLFAKILCELGKYSQAVKYYNKLLLKELSNKFKSLIHSNLATTLHNLDLYTNAQEHLNKALALNNPNTTSTSETNFPSLQSIYAIAPMPSRLIILNNKGILHQKNDEIEEARKSFKEALEEQGTSIEMSIVNNNLGHLENLCGNIEKARQYLAEAVKLAENSIWLHRFKKDLDNVEQQLKRNELQHQNGTNLSPDEPNSS